MLSLRVTLSTAAALLAAVASSTSAHAHTHHQQAGRALSAQYVLRGLADDNATSTTDYTCPVCGMSTLDMGYDDHNYVVLTGGQRVYTCGMAAYTRTDYDFEVTDTAYLAANMAEFVTSTAACDNSCDECADGIADPVTNATVSADSFEFVCLTHGQKIYFASADSKAAYLGNVTSTLRYLVEDMVCESATCSDATTITKLSTAASSADAVAVAASSSSGSATSTGMDMGSMDMGSSSSMGSMDMGSGSNAASAVQSTVFGAAIVGLVAVVNAVTASS